MTLNFGEDPVATTELMEKSNQAPTVTLTPGRRRLLVSSLLAGNLMMVAISAAVIGILVPQQVANIDPAGKVNALAVVTAFSSLAAIFVQPIVGALSDRTRSRLGRRSPWIVYGGIGGGLAVVALQFSTSVFAITVIWVIAQILLNAVSGPMSSIIADRIEMRKRATASAFAGVGIAVGGASGVIVGGLLLEMLGVAYTIFGIGAIIVCVLFVILNPDVSSAPMKVDPFKWKAFARSFWISPRKHPDYGWAFAGRFFIVLGYQGIASYLLYILQDYINIPTAQSGIVAGEVAVISMIAITVSTILFGRLSDRLNRRKVFVFAASIIMAAGALIPILSPTIMSMYLYGLLVGIGYGAYLSVDMALMIDVLPSTGSIGKDLGVLNIAINVPAAITPVIAASLLGLFSENYVVIFGYSIIATIISSLMVLPIKSVR